MKIEPLGRRETAVEACEKTLEAKILSDELRPGERLPAERALAEGLGVTRVTLRGALARLSAKGLLQTRQGSGHVVQDFRRVGGPELLGEIVSQAQDPAFLAALAKDLFRVRRALAKTVLESFLESSRRIDTSALEAAIADFEKSVDEGASALEIARKDVLVIGALLDETDSLVLQLCLNPIMSVLQNWPQLRAALYNEPARNVLGFKALAQWLEDPKKDTIDLFMSFLDAGDEATVERLMSGEH